MAEKLQGPTWTHIWTILSILIVVITFFFTGMYLYVDNLFTAHAQQGGIKSKAYEADKKAMESRLLRMEGRSKERFLELKEDLSVLHFKIGKAEQSVQKTNQNVLEELRDMKRRMPKRQ